MTERGLDRSPGRLLMECVVGGVGGALVAGVLPDAGVGTRFFVLVGAFSAPIALLLTPVRGSLGRQAVRYGAALAVVVTLIVSFSFGTDGVSGVALVGVVALVFAIGAVGHAIMVAALGDRIGSERNGT